MKHKILWQNLLQAYGKVGVLVCALDFKSRLGAARAVLGRFDSCTFPPTIQHILQHRLREGGQTSCLT